MEYGGVDVLIDIFLTSTLAGGSGQLHAPDALSPGRKPSIPTG
jgi:hypothetical protein